MNRQWLLRWLAAIVTIALPAIACGKSCEANRASDAVPTPAELEDRGTRIGSIDVVVEDIFDPSRPGEGAKPYRLANDLHLRTRDDVIRSQLLFGEDEPFSQQKIAETERLLRGRRYLYDAWIEPVCYYEAEQTVDLRVRVRDVWSLNPGFSFNRKGGTNKVGLDIEDQDFLGRGELVSLTWGRNVDRDTLLGVYEDPQILGTWWRGRVAYADNTDGSFGELGVGRPFYSLDTRWSAGLGLVAGDRVNSRYEQGDVLDAYTETTGRFEIYGGRSRGLQDGWARRWLAGLRYEDSRFREAPGETLVAPLPQDRKLVYPWVGVEWIEDDFGTAHNQDQLARTEDLHFGRSLRTELGLASPAWGADRTATVARVHGDAGKRFDDGQSMFFTADLTGRVESDGLRDTLLQGEARYYNRQTKHALFFASARGAVAQHPDLDHQLLLGGDNGLRGYPLRYQSGTASALVTLEERFYTDWYPFHLFNIGAAAFADAGRVWGQDVAGEDPLGLLSDVGVGLRIGNTRSGLGNVLHIDVAVPLSRQPGIDAVQFLIETRRGF
jgi:hypothetical protein